MRSDYEVLENQYWIGVAWWGSSHQHGPQQHGWPGLTHHAAHNIPSHPPSSLHDGHNRKEAFEVPFLSGSVPAWSNALGESVPLPDTPLQDGRNGWLLVRSPATDTEGWVYGTSFDRLQYDRSGGRASKRASDRVRSRLWRWTPPPVSDAE
jgi:hypothetical protein